MGFHEGFNETETQTQAALRTALVATVEALPNSFLFFRGNTNSGVREGDDSFFALAFDGNPNFAAAIGVLERVIEQVGERLANAGGIYCHLTCTGRLNADLDALFFGNVAIDIDYLVN